MLWKLLAWNFSFFNIFSRCGCQEYTRNRMEQVSSFPVLPCGFFVWRVLIADSNSLIDVVISAFFLFEWSLVFCIHRIVPFHLRCFIYWQKLWNCFETIQERWILKQEKIYLPLMPTVVSGLRMNRLCCFPLLQKNCHNPRKKRKRKEKKANNYQYLVLLKNSLWKRKNPPLLHAGQGRAT